MGWNAAYEIFEATVVGAYDLGKLDPDLLKVLMEPYRGTDIDSGGSCELRSRDGKTVEQVVVETWGGVWPAAPEGDDQDPTSQEEVWEQQAEAFDMIARGVFGWGM